MRTAKAIRILIAFVSPLSAGGGNYLFPPIVVTVG